MEDLRELIRKVDFSTIPEEEAIDILVDLYPIDATLTLGLLKEVLHGDSDDASLEVAIATLHLAAAQGEGTLLTGDGRKLLRPRSKDQLVDAKLRRFLEASRIFFEEKSGPQVLEATSSMQDAEQRLFILRKWLAAHPLRPDVAPVIEFAIDDALTAPQFTPNATFYREVVTPLPYIAASTARHRILAVLDAQQRLIQAKGPTVDYVRLQLILVHAEISDGEYSRAASRLEDLYLEFVDPLLETEARVTCQGWFVSKLAHMDPHQRLHEYTEIEEIALAEFETTLSSVLKDGAEQYVILGKTFDALSQYLPERALLLAASLNTVERRNAAYCRIIRSICHAVTDTPNWKIAFRAIDEVKPDPDLDSVIVELVQNLCKRSFDPIAARELYEGLIERLAKCLSLSDKVRCMAELAAALSRDQEFADLHDNVCEEIIQMFDTIHSPPDKYRLACEVVTTLRSSCPDLASRIFAYLSEEQHDGIVAINIEQGLFCMLHLLIKAQWGLARSKHLSDNDVTRVLQVLSQVGEPYLRLAVLSRLAFYLWSEGSVKQFSRVVNQDIWPTLTQVLSGDEHSAHIAWRNAYPCLWLEDRDRARAGIANMPLEFRSTCTSSLCYSLLRHQPPGEPFDEESDKGRGTLTFADVQKLLQLCAETDEDFTIWDVAEWIAHIICGRSTGSHFNRTQRAEIARSILELAKTQLPIAHRIQHPGYQILTKAQALRIAEIQGTTWDELLNEGKQLANAADRVYVLAHLADYLPNRRKKVRETVYELVESDADALGTIEDRFQRFLDLASLAANKDKPRASRMVRKAYETLTNFEGRRHAAKESYLVDLAYRVDPDLPMQMAVIYDDDPARERYRQRAQRQLDRLQLKRDIGDNRSSVDLTTQRNNPDLAVATWRALGSLNAGRMVPADVSRLREMFAGAGNYSLATAFPMYSWTLSNLIVKYSDTPDGAKYMRDVFEGVLRATTFMGYFTGDRSGFGQGLEWRQLADDKDHIVVRSGDRERALKFLQDWVRHNAEEQITIVDPYFTANDVEVLFMLMQVDMDLKIRVLTGRSAQKSAAGSISEAYSDAWRRVCDQSPPDAEILLVGYAEGGKAPFHGPMGIVEVRRSTHWHKP